MDGVVCPHYLKIPAIDQPGVFAEVADVLSRRDISIEAVIQRPQAVRDAPAGSGPWVPIVILTNDVAESVVEAAVAELAALAGVTGAVTRIRVADLAAMMPEA